MAYTPPSTVSASDVLTAALWNTQIRDNFNELRSPPFCRVAVTSSVTSYASTDISWSTATHNVGGMWSAGQPTRITAQQTGLYLVTFVGNFSTGPGANNCTLVVTRTPPASVTSNALSALVPRIYSGTTPGQVVSGVGQPTSASVVLRLVQNEYMTFYVNVAGVSGSGSLGPVTLVGSATENIQTSASAIWLGAIA